MMQLKQLLFVLMSVLILTSCEQKEVVSIYEDGSPKMVTFKNDAGDPIKEEHYHPNGKIKIRGHFKNKQRHGTWNAFYDDGTKWSENIYENGKNEGPYQTFWPNGKPYVTGQYQNGEEVGSWKFYGEDGVVSREVEY